jgi:hypothetical protein
VNDEPTCDADSVCGQGYLYSYVVTKDSDIDYLATELDLSSDERDQQAVIEILYENRELLKGKVEAVRIARRKANAMRGSLVDRIFFGNSTIEEIKQKISLMESVTSRNQSELGISSKAE